MPNEGEGLIAPLPASAILLHVGPHKTGTTSLQYAAAHRRDELAAAGVTYPERGEHHSTAARAVGERGWGWADRGGAPSPGIDRWRQLVDEVRAAPGRVLVSSEFFGELDADHIARVVADLGRERLHVAITLRPLRKIMPSSWQQYLKGGSARPFESWLSDMLSVPPNPKVTPNFWQRQDHAALVGRWAAAVDPQRVSVLVLDDADRAMLPRTFEALLDLPPGMLDPAPGARTNRSMTAAECEVVRRANAVITGRDVGWRNYERMFRNAGIVRMVEGRRPDDGETPLRMPPWALARTAELGRRAAADIETSGVRVIGDLALLHAGESGVSPAGGDTAPEHLPVPDTVPVDAAVDLAVGILSGALGGGPFLGEEVERGRIRAAPPPGDAARRPAEPAVPVREATSTELVKVLRSRAARKVRARVRR